MVVVGGIIGSGLDVRVDGAPIDPGAVGWRHG
jgi:hypothetical protein